MSEPQAEREPEAAARRERGDVDIPPDRLVSEVAPGGQLDVWAEYSVAGIQISGKNLPTDGWGHIGGFKYQISKDVQKIVEEFKGRHLLVRPSAITQWLGKYQAMGLPIIDRASGNRVGVRTAGLEFDAWLRPDVPCGVLSERIAMLLDFICFKTIASS